MNNKFEDIKYEIIYKLRNIKYFFLSIGTGLTNLWKWKKIIYSDRWWDYSFFMTILKFKLETMYDNWDNSHYVGSEYEKEELKTLIKLLEKIEEVDELDPQSAELYDELYRRLFTTTTVHKIDKEFKDGELYQKSIGIQRFWD